MYILNDTTKFECFRQFVFELLNFQIGTFGKFCGTQN
jgi:hypothetical protein